jgi:hypothetical protein
MNREHVQQVIDWMEANPERVNLNMYSNPPGSENGTYCIGGVACKLGGFYANNQDLNFEELDASREEQFAIDFLGMADDNLYHVFMWGWVGDVLEARELLDSSNQEQATAAVRYLRAVLATGDWEVNQWAAEYNQKGPDNTFDDLS